MEEILIIVNHRFNVFVSCKNDSNNNSVNSANKDFMIQASYSNNAEIGTGAIARTNGSADSVTMFGAMMLADHGASEVSLDSAASALSVAIPGSPDAAHIPKADSLKMMTGHTFDTAYINTQVIDHAKTIAIFNTEISSGNNSTVLTFAKTHLPVI